jgi:hypothetical protein
MELPREVGYWNLTTVLWEEGELYRDFHSRQSSSVFALILCFDGWVVEAVFHGSRGQLLICPCWEVRVFTRVACSLQ